MQNDRDIQIVLTIEHSAYELLKFLPCITNCWDQVTRLLSPNNWLSYGTELLHASLNNHKNKNGSEEDYNATHSKGLVKSSHHPHYVILRIQPGGVFEKQNWKTDCPKHSSSNCHKKWNKFSTFGLWLNQNRNVIFLFQICDVETENRITYAG